MASSLGIRRRNGDWRKVNQIRGLLAEYGIVVGQAIEVLRKALPCLLEDAENGLSADFRLLLKGLQEDLLALDERVAELDKRIHTLAHTMKTLNAC